MQENFTGPASNPSSIFSIQRSRSPLVGTAIHDGHQVWPQLAEKMALDAEGRLREEDPFTAQFIAEIPNQLIVHRSRFELDLNRAAEGAIYFHPDQAWGLRVWREQPAADEVARLMRQHASYYSALRHMLSDIEAEHGRFVLLDMHSYNHRRDGPSSLPTPQDAAPDINIGTFSMDRERWAHVLDPFIERLRQCNVQGRPLDVRENVAFVGKGEQTRFVHEHFPATGCAIAVEVKKIFMDEWTGQPDQWVIHALRQAFASTLPLLEKALGAQA